MAPAITASLVSGDSPQLVQVVVTGVQAGYLYEVTGVTRDGSAWPVPGGQGVSTGSQVVLVDNRSALNTPVTYTLTVTLVGSGAGWGGGGPDVNGRWFYTAPEITVPFDGQYVLQSLDGHTAVEFVWRDDDLTNEPTVYSRSFDVPGRSRPPVRIAPGGDGGGSLSIRTNRVNSDRLRSLLRSGAPVVIRTDGQVRDFPAVDIVLITGAPNELWRAVTSSGMSTDRVWSLSYLLVDDPEPGTPLSAFIWDDFDAAMSSRTWDQFDALFAASTWDEFDTYDWEQL